MANELSLREINLKLKNDKTAEESLLGCSSVGRTADSGSAGRRFEPCHPSQKPIREYNSFLDSKSRVTIRGNPEHRYYHVSMYPDGTITLKPREE